MFGRKARKGYAVSICEDRPNNVGLGVGTTSGGCVSFSNNFVGEKLRSEELFYHQWSTLNNLTGNF